MNINNQTMHRICRSLCIGGVVMAAAASPGNCSATGVIYTTAPYWPVVSASLGGMGAGQSSTIGETFVAPAGAGVTLNDFTFYAESYYPYNGGIASIHLQPFVYTWSGSLTGNGGGATGNALYLGSSFLFSPGARPNGWTPLTASIGGNGLVLNAGQQYVIGFTMSVPSDYAASQGDIEFQTVPARNPNYSPPPIPAGVNFGGGSAVWLNNGNNFGALNSTVWDTWGDIGPMSFTADFTVVPEPSTLALAFMAVGFWIAQRKNSLRPRLVS